MTTVTSSTTRGGHTAVAAGRPLARTRSRHRAARRLRPLGPTAALNDLSETAELAAEAAGVQAELGQQVGVLAVLGVDLVRELLAFTSFPFAGLAWQCAGHRFRSSGG